ncbi:MAG: NAD-dependent epimerase/dehydratase family protein, partial [Acidobacteria bacterium]
MRVLVTGATGYLGRAIVAALDAAGHVPVAFARKASRAGLTGETVDGDVRDATAIERAAAGCAAICHTAALVAVWRRDPREFDEVNVGGLANVLAAARRARIPRIVYTSSFMALPPTGGEAPQPWNDYQRTKAAADRLAGRAVAQGAPLVRLYPGVIYGPGPLTEGNLVGRMVADHLAGRLPGLLGAECRWSYAFVQDVAAGHVAALERGRIGGRYQLGGENVRQMAIFEIVRELTGAALPRRIPAAAAVLVAAAEELRALLTGRPPLLTIGTVEILQR